MRQIILAAVLALATATAIASPMDGSSGPNPTDGSGGRPGNPAEGNPISGGRR